jgi:hypothetical protein
MASPSELLRTHRPVLKYDSNEVYFADSAAEWTDHRGNRLKRGGVVLAEAGGGDGKPGLSLEVLGGDYADGILAGQDPKSRKAVKSDLIVCADDDYAADAGEMHEDPAYRNKMYGRAVREPRPGGALWLQYWFFYFYNDFNLIGPLIKAGLHEGDWEMIQLRLGEDDVPDLAVYAQHTEADVRPWAKVERAEGGDRPVVYVARGSHASYFTAGSHPLGTFGIDWLAHGVDQANGERATPELELLEIKATEKEWSWIDWPGHWGGTTGGPVPLIDDSSPTGPIEHAQWHDPAALIPKAEAKQARLAGTTPPPRPTLDSVEVHRTASGLAIDYRATPADGEQFLGLAVTVNSKDEAGVPPKAHRIEASAPTGTADLALPLDSAKAYDVTVSAAFAPHLATESITVDLPPDPAQPAPTTPPPPAGG